MLTIFENSKATRGYRNGTTRRDFLTVGGLVPVGLTLADVYSAEARSPAAPAYVGHQDRGGGRKKDSPVNGTSMTVVRLTGAS